MFFFLYCLVFIDTVRDYFNINIFMNDQFLCEEKNVESPTIKFSFILVLKIVRFHKKRPAAAIPASSFYFYCFARLYFVQRVVNTSRLRSLTEQYLKEPASSANIIDYIM